MGETEQDVAKPFVGVVSLGTSCTLQYSFCDRHSQLKELNSLAEQEIYYDNCYRWNCHGSRRHEIIFDFQRSHNGPAELTVRGHCYDALVGIAGCDKSLPGLMMSMLRLNVPSVFIYGGSILPGKFKGKDVTVVDVFEAVGKHSSGKMSSEELRELELVACPSAGACGGQFTANTMACVSEAIGLALLLNWNASPL